MDALVLKSTAFHDGQGNISLIAYFYCPSETKKSLLRGCFLRTETRDGWESFLEGLNRKGPAEPFEMELSGAQENLKILRHVQGPLLTVFDVKRIISRRVFSEKMKTLGDFLAQNRYGGLKYLEKFGDTNIWDLPPGVWHMQDIKFKTTRAPKRVIM